MTLALLTNNMRFEGWTAIEVNRSMANLCGSFNLTVTDKWQGVARLIRAGDTCKIMIDDDQIINGYVDSVYPRVDGRSHQIMVIGRDKGGDLIDCSIADKKGQWRGLKLEALISELCKPFGIKVTANVDTGSTVNAADLFKSNQGVTVFEAIKRICSLNGCLAYSDNEGNLLITRAGTEKATTAIVQGVNMLAGDAAYDNSNRYSHYIVKGQQSGGDQFITPTGKPSPITEPHATVIDENMARYRPLVILADGQADTAKCQQRAKWEASTREGKSRYFNVTVSGWRQDDGQLWSVNQLARLTSEYLEVDEDLLIEAVDYVLDEMGEKTRLTLVPKQAYDVLPDLKVKKKKDSSNEFIKG